MSYFFLFDWILWRFFFQHFISFFISSHITTLRWTRNSRSVYLLRSSRFANVVSYFWATLLVLVLFTTLFIELRDILLMMVRVLFVASACYSIALDKSTK